MSPPRHAGTIFVQARQTTSPLELPQLEPENRLPERPQSLLEEAHVRPGLGGHARAGQI